MTTTLPAAETLRQTDLATLIETITSQRARAIDVIRPARELAFAGSILELNGLDRVLTPDGFMDANGLYTPTQLALGHLDDKLKIGLPYLRKMYAQKPELFAENVNTWLLEDDRSYMLRLLRSDDSPTGILRAILSPKYLRYDNIDILMATLAGIQAAEVTDPVVDADLTETRMVVRVTVPSMAVHAEELLKNYRSPFDGSDVSMGWTPDRVRRASQREGMGVEGGGKLVFAGIVITNSEVGGGRWKITPRIVVQVCNNGLTFTADGLKKTHLGAEQEDGILEWSAETQRINLDLITSQTVDVVKTYLNPEYVAKKVAELERKAGEPISQPTEVIAAVSKELAFSKEQQALILDHFIRGGQTTVGGIMQAITSAAQVVRNGDTAFDMEEAAVKAMSVAHTANKALASK